MKRFGSNPTYQTDNKTATKSTLASKSNSNHHPLTLTLNRNCPIEHLPLDLLCAHCTFQGLKNYFHSTSVTQSHSTDNFACSTLKQTECPLPITAKLTVHSTTLILQTLDVQFFQNFLRFYWVFTRFYADQTHHIIKIAELVWRKIPFTTRLTE